ncbi:hypothetical protein GCM10023192_31160 [Amycolatopsis samaneae]
MHALAERINQLIRDPDLTPKELAERIGVSKSAVSQHLTRLEQDDYLAREKSPHDGRVHVFRLRARGESYRQAMRQYEEYLADTYTSRLSPAEMEEIVASLEKLKRAFED